MEENKDIVFKERLINKTPAFIEWLITKIENSMGVVFKIMVMIVITFIWLVVAKLIWIATSIILPQLLPYI